MSFLKDWYNYIFFYNPNKLHDYEREELVDNPYTTTVTSIVTVNKPFLSNLRHAMRKG